MSFANIHPSQNIPLSHILSLISVVLLRSSDSIQKNINHNSQRAPRPGLNTVHGRWSKATYWVLVASRRSDQLLTSVSVTRHFNIMFSVKLRYCIRDTCHAFYTCPQPSWPLPPTGIYVCVATPTFACHVSVSLLRARKDEVVCSGKTSRSIFSPTLLYISRMSCLRLRWPPQSDTMEMECVAAVEDNRRLTQLRFDAAVKVIKSLPPDGKHWQPLYNTRPSFIYSFPPQNVASQQATVVRDQVQQSNSSVWLGARLNPITVLTLSNTPPPISLHLNAPEHLFKMYSQWEIRHQSAFQIFQIFYYNLQTPFPLIFFRSLSAVQWHDVKVLQLL